MSQAVAAARGGVAVRLSVVFAAIFFVTGSSLPYLPLWFASVGLTPRQIGVIGGCALLARVLVAPAIAFAADRSGDHRRFLRLCAWSALLGQLLLAQLGAFWPILWCSLAIAVASSGIMPLAETLAIKAMAAVNLDYGRMRLWGSLSFTAAVLGGGWLLQQTAPEAIFGLLIAGSLLLALGAQALSRAAPALGPTRARARPSLNELAQLVGSATFLLFLATAGTIQATHAAFYTFGTLHWRALGISPLVAGLLWTVGVAAEILVFAFSRPALQRAGAAGMLALGAGAGLVRWSVMAFDPALPVQFALQTLHGLTFGATHVGAIHFMARFVPDGHGSTAQALYAAVSSGVLLGGATLLVGPLYADYGGRAYLAMAALAALALLCALRLRQLPLATPAGPSTPACG
jgi:PPP family 3-phenylpropionic acid transporter